jgi:hypothetical protein
MIEQIRLVVLDDLCARQWVWHKRASCSRSSATADPVERSTMISTSSQRHEDQQDADNASARAVRQSFPSPSRSIRRSVGVCACSSYLRRTLEYMGRLSYSAVL